MLAIWRAEWFLGQGPQTVQGRSEGLIWERGKVSFRIQRRNTHRTSPRRGPCQEVAESAVVRTGVRGGSV